MTSTPSPGTDGGEDPSTDSDLCAAEPDNAEVDEELLDLETVVAGHSDSTSTMNSRGPVNLLPRPSQYAFDSLGGPTRRYSRRQIHGLVHHRGSTPLDH